MSRGQFNSISPGSLEGPAQNEAPFWDREVERWDWGSLGLRRVSSCVEDPVGVEKEETALAESLSSHEHGDSLGRKTNPELSSGNGESWVGGRMEEPRSELQSEL